EGFGGGGDVGGAVQQVALRAAKKVERPADAVGGEKVLAVPVLDVGGDAAAGVEQAETGPVGDLVVNDGQVGGAGARGAEQGGGGTEGVDGGGAAARGEIAGEADAGATQPG